MKINECSSTFGNFLKLFDVPARFQETFRNFSERFIKETVPYIIDKIYAYTFIRALSLSTHASD